MPGAEWLTGRLLSVPDEGPSGGGDKKIEKMYIIKYRSPGDHSEHAHPKTTNSDHNMHSICTEPKGAQLEHIEYWDRQSYQ